MPTNNDLQYRIAESQGNWPVANTGQETVGTPGTAVQFNGGTSLTIPDGSPLLVSAPSGNTGDVFIGDDMVDSGTGFVLAPGTEQTVYVGDVNTLYVDAANTGDSVSWFVATES